MTILEREAWAAAYRIYDEYAPGLRQAAALTDGNEMAVRLFSAALDKLKPTYSTSDAGGRLIMAGVYGILEDVFIEARERAQEAAKGNEQGNIPPSKKACQIA